MSSAPVSSLASDAAAATPPVDMPPASDGAAFVPLHVLPSSEPAIATFSSDDFQMDCLPISFFRELIDANGG
jgi:hypothetical protein